MNAEAIAKLVIILAPIAKDVVIEGGKIVATMRADISQADLDKALELSKSAAWPELNFGLDEEAKVTGP